MAHKEDNPRGRREVITLLSPALTDTTIVQLYNHQLVEGGTLALSATTSESLGLMGSEKVRYLLERTYSTMGLWLVLKHIVSPYAASHVEVPGGNSLDVASWGSRKPLHTNLVTDQDQKYLDELVKHDQEPLFHTTTEFSDYFDVAVYKGPEVDPIFPAVCTLEPGNPICVFSYNGYPDRGIVESILNAVYGSHPQKPTYEHVVSLFYGLGKKTVSFGQVKAVSPKGLVTYDCSLLTGASGGLLYKIGSEGNTFCGIHEGGEFDSASATAYNYGYMTSHVGIVLLYAKYIYPFYSAAGPLPAPLLEYFRFHKATLEAHQAFITNDILSVL